MSDELTRAMAQDALLRVAQLEGLLAQYIEDYPEQEDSGVPVPGEGGGTTFTGVVLAGVPYTPDQFDTHSSVTESTPATYLQVDTWLLKITWHTQASESWWIDSIPVGMLSGLLIYKLVPHYVDDDGGMG
jgi:hypothetical protein